MKSFDFWVIALLGSGNVVIAGIRAARNNEPLQWCSFVLILLATVIVVRQFKRVQNGISELGEQVDDKAAQRLQMRVSSMAFYGQPSDFVGPAVRALGAPVLTS